LKAWWQVTEQTVLRPLAQSWCYAGHIDSIPLGEGRTVVVEGRRIAVFRSRSGRLHATQAECPHRGGPLADGVVADSTVVCPLHEFKFDLETGSPRGSSCQALKVYPVSVDATGEIAVLLDTVL
jgi:nitrite reductase (NADH) small subunit